jgi:hypothetical protein
MEISDSATTIPLINKTVQWNNYTLNGIYYGIGAFVAMGVAHWLQDLPGIIGLVVIPDLLYTPYYIYWLHFDRYGFAGEVLAGHHCYRTNKVWVDKWVHNVNSSLETEECSEV